MSTSTRNIGQGLRSRQHGDVRSPSIEEEQEPTIARKQRRKRRYVTLFACCAFPILNSRQDKFDLNDPVIYQPSLGEAISLEIAAVDPDGDRNILYRLRYRSDHNHDGPMYTDTARSVDLFKGEELEDDSDPA